jgi:hypothetical protein
MEETPHGRTDIIREAQTHFGVLNVVATEIDIQESHIMGKFPGLPSELCPFAAFLYAVEIEASKPPSLLNF